MESVQDLYCVLGLKPSATQADIRRAFRQRARWCHPDAAPPDTMIEFFELTNAYRILGHPDRRRVYDTERLRYLAATMSCSQHVFVGGFLQPPSPAPRTPPGVGSRTS